ncbi:MAG: DNA polymerase III subunit alpha [bacterium]|nr:DNA polymerase III subunit alpha [bacterium]
MSDQPFVHLHVHTEFSLLDGLSKIGRLVDHAKSMEMPALAITDHGTMFGVIDFYRACKKAGIKPILGMEGYLAPRTMRDKDARLDSKAYHLLMLSQNETGYQNLLKIASAAQLEGYYYRPRIDKDFLNAHKDGVITTTGCLAAEIPQLVMAGQEAKARERIHEYVDIFGRDHFYLELQQHDIPDLGPVNAWLIETAERDNLPLLATADVHYVYENDFEAHDTLLCIQSSALKTDTNRLKMSDNSYYLIDQRRMWEWFGHIRNGEALTNSIRISEMCALDLDKKDYHLPVFPVPEGHDSASYLAKLAYKGLEWRYGDRARTDAALKERLDYELRVIDKMGFNTYFLIVWDLCEYARAADIWWNVRGSGAGCLVAYCTGITNIDPIQNNLLFERFLNPGRSSMPDIDMDFPDDRRGEMISYAVRKYGEDKVAAIITFGTMGAKAAVRDVGRALDLDLSLVNEAAKLIPTEPKPKPVHQYVDDNPDLKRMYDTDARIKAVIDTAAQLQGVVRHASTHAAGVIIADKPLEMYVPLHRPTKGEAKAHDDEFGDGSSGGSMSLSQVTQFPMETCESIGLLKVDFLGLSTLTILRRACDLIAKHHGDLYSMDNIPYRPTGDAERDRMLRETFDMIGQGHTVGVFQVESSGMQQMLREMRPTKFEHIIAAVSLYRPGPMDFIPTYNARMHGREAVEYHHAKMETILSETYGIIVYQEQLMQVASELFGYSLGDADLMRRAVSKKKKDDLIKHKGIFIEQGPKVDPTITPAIAEKIFDEIEFFANYGFNKSHAADYAVITVQTAFLKAHYPAEYMAALLSVYLDDPDKMAILLDECRRLELPLMAPDINYSSLDFDIQNLPDGSRGIRFGLAAVKNAGVGALTPLLHERDAHGHFLSLQDFCERIDLRPVGKRTLESLIKVGAFDAMGKRQQLMQALDRIMSFSAEHHKAKEVGQFSLFGETTGAPGTESGLLDNLPQVEEAPVREILDWEKELLGIYVSQHPIDRLWSQLRGTHNLITTQEIKAWDDTRSNTPVQVIGLVAGLRKMPTKSKDMMCIVSLEDRYGTIDAVFFPRRWAEFQDEIAEGKVYVFFGKADRSRGNWQIVCEGLRTSFEDIGSASDPVSVQESAPAWMAGAPAPEPPARRMAFGVQHNGTHGNGSDPQVPELPPLPDFDPTYDPGLPTDAPDWALDPTSLPPLNLGDGWDEDVQAPVRTLIVRMERGANDVRRWKRIQNHLREYHGRDVFSVQILQDGAVVDEYEFDWTTEYCEELRQKLERISGVSVELIPDASQTGF